MSPQSKKHLYSIDPAKECGFHYEVLNLMNDHIWDLEPLPSQIFQPSEDRFQYYILNETPILHPETPRIPRRTFKRKLLRLVL